MTAHLYSEDGTGRQWDRPTIGHVRKGELDHALPFLASDASRDVTGHVLAVDGAAARSERAGEDDATAVAQGL